MYDYNKQIDAFWDEKVRLSAGFKEKLLKHRQTNRDRLNSGLPNIEGVTHYEILIVAWIFSKEIAGLFPKHFSLLSIPNHRKQLAGNLITVQIIAVNNILFLAQLDNNCLHLFRSLLL